MFSIYLNTLLIDKEHLLEKSEEEALGSDFTHIVKTYRKIGQCLTYCDYSKIALGFVQLASMARLAIEIRYSVANLLRNEIDDDADSIELRFKSMTAIKSYR